MESVETRSVDSVLPKLAYNVEDTAFMLGELSDKSIYRLLKRGELRALPGIRHKMVTTHSINAFLNRATSAG